MMESRGARDGRAGSLKCSRFLGLLGACLLAPGLAGCGSTASAHIAAIRIPVYGGADPALLDPARMTTSTPVFLPSLLHAGLVKFGPDLHVIPELAVSIPTISSSGKSYTFTVRQDARFDNGRHCTAADVAYSFARALSPTVKSSLARAYLGGIVGASEVEAGSTTHLRGIRVVNRLTVRIRLQQADATFLEKLAFPVADIVDRHSPPGPPSGLGPWRLLARQRDGVMLLVPRRHFYGGTLRVKALRLIPTSTTTRGIEMYRKGALDVARVPDEQFHQFSRRSDFRESDALDAYYAVPDGQSGLRLAATLDREKMFQQLGPEMSPLSSIVPPAVPDYVGSSPTVDGSTADDSPVDVRILPTSSSDSRINALRQQLSHQWKTSRGRPLRVRIVHVTYGLPDPGRWLLTVLTQTGSHWFRQILVQAARLTNDPVSRMSLYGEGETWALKKGLIIPLATGSIGYLIKPSVGNLQITPAGLMPENDNWTLVSVT